MSIMCEWVRIVKIIFFFGERNAAGNMIQNEINKHNYLILINKKQNENSAQMRNNRELANTTAITT